MFDGGVPNVVASGGEVQTVFLEQFRPGHAIVAKHRIPDVNKMTVGLFLALRFDEAICLLHRVGELPTAGARFDGDEKNVGFGERGVDGFFEGGEVLADLFGGFAPVDVIVASVNDDGPRLVADDEQFDVADGIAKLRAAEPTIDRIPVGESFVDLPKADAGTADEHDAAGSAGGLLVEFFKILHRAGPAVGFGLRGGFAGEKGGARAAEGEAQEVTHQARMHGDCPI